MVYTIWIIMEKSWVKRTLGIIDPSPRGPATVITNQPRRNDAKTADYQTYYTKSIYQQL